MSNTAIKTVSEVDEGFLRIPYELLGEGFAKFSAAELLSLAKVLTYSCVKEQPTARCRSKISEFAADFHISERHSSRLINRLIKAKIIEKVTDENGKLVRSWYRYIGEPTSGKSFIRIDMANLQTEFEFEADEDANLAAYKRYLTLPEVLVLSYMVTHCDNIKKRKNVFEGSYRSIGRVLKLSPSTVSNAITNLNKAHLVFLYEGSKAVNGSGWTKYRVNSKLLLRTQREYQKEVEDAAKTSQPTAQEGQAQKSVVYVSPQVAAANAKADRERYYANRRQKAQNIAVKQLDRANQDPEFNAASKELSQMEISLAKAEVFGRYEELRRLQRERKAIQRRRLARLEAIGMCEADFEPRWTCAQCSDTGWLPNGRGCDCYPGQK